jgi:hypothetical protein
MKAHTVLAVVLGCTVILAGATTLWLQAGPGQSALEPASTLGRGEPAQGGTIPDREALNAQISRLRAGKEALERRAGEVKSELDALRSGLTQVNRNQSAIDREVMRLGGALPADGKEPPAFLTPEQVREQADARIEAQLETLEGTMRVEKADPSAQASLQQAFQRAGIAGLQLANAQCGGTLCRMELASDGSGFSEDSFRSLSHIAPWPGQGFARVDSESGNITVYVAREGHTLPNAGGSAANTMPAHVP